MKTLKRALNEYPILLGIFGIFILIVFLTVFMGKYNANSLKSTIETEETERQKTINRARTPAEAVFYFLKAVENEDLDQTLRIFPIGESLWGTNLTNVIKQKNGFNADLTAAPACNYGMYYYIALAEMTAKYADLYDTFCENIHLQNMVLTEIQYMPIENSEKEQYILLRDTIGAAKICKMEAVFEDSAETYKIPFTLVKYNKYWKVYQVAIEITPLDTKELDEEPKLSEEEEKKKKAVERLSKVNRKILKSGKAMLGRNYEWTSANYGATPEQLMETFMKYVQKNSIDILMTLGNVNGEEWELQYVNSNTLINKGLFAEKMKYFYFSILLGEDANVWIPIDEYNISAAEITQKLNPLYFHQQKYPSKYYNFQ